MYCRECGKELPGKGDFCPNCGTKIKNKGTIPSTPGSVPDSSDAAKVENHVNASKQAAEQPVVAFVPKETGKDQQRVSKSDTETTKTGQNKGQYIIIAAGIVVVFLFLFMMLRKRNASETQLAASHTSQETLMETTEKEGPSKEMVLAKETTAAQTIETTTEEITEEETTTEAITEEETTPVLEEESEFIFPNSDKELITEEDLDKLTKEEVRIARNEIYARHGRRFKDNELQEYFDGCSWYHGTVSAEMFSENVFNSIEAKNKNFIVQYEDRKGYSR